MENLLSVENLRVSYHSYAGEVQSVRGISFAVASGEAVAIVGESGCGKSVTAKSIMGLIQSPPGEVKSGGKIEFDGRDLLSFSKEEWRAYRGAGSAIIFQDALAALNPTLTIGLQVTEKLRAHSQMTQKEATAAAVHLLSLVGITDPERRLRQYPHAFSGGMRQRVMIAIALACNPKLLIADEPTTALDVTIQADIIDLIKHLQAELHMAVIMITHDLGIVADMAQRILVMYAGKIVESGSAQNIFYRPKHPYTQALLRSVPRLDLDGRQQLASIPGGPPSMINPPLGCAFCNRCRHAMQVCAKQAPPDFVFEDRHIAACWCYYPKEVSHKEEGVPEQ